MRLSDFFKKKKEPRKLSNLDRMSMEEVNKLSGKGRGVPKEQPITFNSRRMEGLCKSCGEKMERVVPEKMLNGLHLHECPECGKREYLRIF